MVDDEKDSVTVQVLRQIRDQVGQLGVGLSEVSGRILETNQRLDQTNQRLDQTNQRLDQTNQRLDHLAEGQIRLATEVTTLRGDVVELKVEVKRQGQRFDHFLSTEGNVVRDLRHRVERLEEHAGLPPPSPRRR